MALIACKECGKEISNKTLACVHCGAPTKNVVPSSSGVPWWMILLVIGFVIVLVLPNKNTSTGSSPENEKVRKKIDFSLPVYTTSRAMVCPLSAIMDHRHGMGEEGIRAALRKIFGRSEAVKNVGCEEWQKGEQLFLTSGDEDRNGKLFAFFQYGDRPYVVVASDLTNSVTGDVEYELREKTKSSQNLNPSPVITLASVPDPSPPQVEVEKVETYQASFDCTKAQSTAETFICGDLELATLDTELSKIFVQAKASNMNKQQFDADNRQAWKWREKNCLDKACLLSWYADRKRNLLLMLNRGDQPDTASSIESTPPSASTEVH